MTVSVLNGVWQKTALVLAALLLAAPVASADQAVWPGHAYLPLMVNTQTVTGTSATLGSDDYVILVDDDTAAATVTITLPAAASNLGRVYHIKKLGNTASVVLDGNASDTIDGAPTHTLTTQYDARTIVCDGISNWSIF